MDAAQAHRRQEKPPARGRVAARYIRPIGVDLREPDLSTRQALLGRRQQPPHRLRPVADDGIAVIVHAVVVEDAEIALGAGVARFCGFGAAVSRRRRSSPVVPGTTRMIAIDAVPSRCLPRKVRIDGPR